MATTVYVNNINYNAGTKDLGEAFEIYGKVVRANILSRFFRGQRRSQGRGFVEFTDEEAVKKAVEQSGTLEIMERKVKVQVARPRRPRVTAFVAGIPAGTTKEMILEAFKAFKPADAKIVHENQEEPKRRGFGFVKFEKAEDLTECLKAGKTIQLNGEESIVRSARNSFDSKPRRRFHRGPRKAAAAPETPAQN